MRLSRPISELGGHYDAIVVGSGYGGGVAASRLARMGLRVAVLERGKEILPGEFPDTPVEAILQTQVESKFGRIGERTALFDLHAGDDINVLVGCGLGGTSLINANVSLRADPRVLDDPAWPAALRDTDLETGYARAFATLGAAPYPEGNESFPTVGKLKAMRDAADKLGVGLDLPPINVSFEDGFNGCGVWQPACNLCGDCCSGCNTGAKNTTQMNYLPDAEAFGAQIFCGIRVRSVSARNPGWTVHYVPQGFDREKFDAGELAISADIVVLGAGTLGSTEILLRARARGLALSDRIGQGFTGNGDVLAFGYNNDQPIDGVGFGEDARTYDFRKDSRRPVGPTIVGALDLRGSAELDRGMIIEEGAIPGGLAAFLPALVSASAGVLGDGTDEGDFFEEKAREIESLVRGAYHGSVNHTQTFLVMAHDGADGEIRLDKDRITVVWSGVGERPVFQEVAAKVREAVATTGGTYVPNPIWTDLLNQSLITVHPLGGCAMGEDASSGVVNHKCQVFAGTGGNAVHDGLYVCDGSVIPRSLGVNPLLTISGISERAMIKLGADRGWTIDEAPARPRPAGEAAPRTIGIRFTEKMRGKVTSSAGGEATPAHFVVTVVARDADRLLKDSAHEADLVGTVHLPAVSDNVLTVEGGRFNLFVQSSENRKVKHMEYRMPLVTVDGRRFHFFGRKLIHDAPGLDMWPDTTTLQMEIHEGAEPVGAPAFTGTLNIAPQDFARQLTTMEVMNAPNALKRLDTMRKFGLFFAGQLFDTYAAPAGSATTVWPAPGSAGGIASYPPLFGTNRALSCAPLERFEVTALDGTPLVLHRTKGGDRGPVVLTPGTAMTALSYLVDTVPESFAEYLAREGFDVWLFDWRTSPLLDSHNRPYTLDDVARYDWPAGIGEVRKQTGADDVAVLAHCLSSPTLLLSLVRGYLDPSWIRSIVASQVALHLRFTPTGTTKLGMRLDKFLPRAQMVHQRPQEVRMTFSDIATSVLAKVLPKSFNCDNPVCSRHVATFGELALHSRLNDATHAAMGDLVPECLTGFLKDVAIWGRKDSILTDEDRAHLGRLKLPILFISGSENRMFVPQSTEESYGLLCKVNGQGDYRHNVFEGFGHLDFYLGDDAPAKIWPELSAWLGEA